MRRPASTQRSSAPEQQGQSADGSKRRREDTPFEKRVYAALKAIPKGKVTTYGALAAVLKSSARAVGQGMRHNPYAPEVPCHRVIASSFKLGGFNGSWGDETEDVRRKRKMLMEEGVRFTKAAKVEAECVCGPQELLLLLPKELLSSA
ncbi:6-O-methylguanine DNA methyltransferase [Dunaliella salina]|uniref:Methylated-DNA--protein-cysteine methyltransferase n=1 Tax=Dunaliella salina TaxID=3046 RepID=A0ABQ7G761_DUNSA|nr:6-O-methylguanine DNA methyltransferase [Dunaliella salina]|eukprot:KAF5830435.1 6-O-methylguanine DNA methyltransferase [Dunaliella salina]